MDVIRSDLGGAQQRATAQNTSKLIAQAVATSTNNLHSVAQDFEAMDNQAAQVLRQTIGVTF